MKKMTKFSVLFATAMIFFSASSHAINSRYCAINLMEQFGFSASKARTTCAMDNCGFNLVMNFDYSTSDAKKICRLSRCAQQLVIEFGYSINEAKKGCGDWTWPW